MKLIKKLLGIAAFIAVIGFMTLLPTGCDNDTTSSGGGTKAIPDDGTTPDGKTLVGITVANYPTKVNIGEELDKTDLVVTAIYSDESTAAVTDYTLSYNKGVKGNHPVTVTYKDKTAEFIINVFDPNLPTAATPTASPAAGTYIKTQSVTLSSTEGAAIYYTLDGTNPTTASTSYTSAISISETTTLKAFAFKDDMNDSDILTAQYTFPSVTELTVGGKWTDGNIPDAGGEQWFKFTQGTGTSAYIHFLQGSMFNVYVQLYTTEGGTQGSRSNFSNYTYSTQSNLTPNTVYYIKVTPYSSAASGTYRIGVNTSSSTSPSINIPYTGAISLTDNTWTAGNITSAVYEQWFTFTAGGTSTYIHFLPDALTSAYVQLYDSNGAPVSSSQNLNRGIASVSRNTSASGTYYILLQPYSSSYSGAYKIAYGTTSTQPAITVPSGTIPELTADTWADGNITTAGGEQWFKFTANAVNQYIHFLPGTLTDVYVRLFIADGTNVGDTTNLYTSTISTTRTLTSGTVYFIKVTPFNTASSGAYKIGFNTTTTTPKVTPSPIPTTGYTNLTDDVFSDGNIATAGGEEWFKFTSTSATGSATTVTNYIHFDSTGTLSNVYVQLYTSDGRLLGGSAYLYGSYSTYASRTVTTSTVYYIKVTPSSSTGKGAYKIGFGTSTATPKITLPTTDVTTLTADKWSDGNIATAGGEQWFKFTSAASGTSAYIYFQAGTLSNVYVQMYTNDGRTSGSRSSISSSYLNRTVTASTEYYIKVTPYSSTGNGTYKLGVTASSSTTPTAP